MRSLAPEIVLSWGTMYRSPRPHRLRRYFYFFGVDHFELHDLNLYGLGAEDGHNGSEEDPIYIHECDLYTVKNCYIYDVSGQAAIMARESSYGKIIDNYIDEFSYAGIQVLGDSQNVWVKRNTIMDCAAVTENSGNAYGIHISVGLLADGELYPKNVWVTENSIFNIPSWEGIDAHGGENIWVQRNQVYNCGYGIAMQNVYYNASSKLKNVTIEDNKIYGATSDVGASTYSAGISISGNAYTDPCLDIKIINNTVSHACEYKANKRGGVYVNNIKGVTITGNHVQYCGNYGIRLGGAVSNFVIQGNTLKRNTTYGLYLGYGRIESGIVNNNICINYNDGDGYDQTYAVSIGTPGSYNVYESRTIYDADTTFTNITTQRFKAEIYIGTIQTAYKLQDQVIFQPSQVDGSITNKSCSNRVDTAIRVAAAATDTIIQVDDTTGILAGDYIGIVLDGDDAAQHWTSVDSITDGDTLVLVSGLPAATSAAIGNTVYSCRLVSEKSTLRGSVAIADSDTSATVTFDVAQPNTSYYIYATINGATAGSAFGVIYISDKATSGFKINVSTAPTAGKTLTIDWHLSR